jgi:hypothetical protein
MGVFPYDSISDYQNWRKAVTQVDNSKLDPQSGTKFICTRDTKFVSAGSCFAQRIAESLQDYGFSYYVVEPGPPWLTREQKLDYSYGVYSARYGNLYTTLQLLQLMQRVRGEFQPVDEYWEAEEGYYVDPFRPSIQPQGFASVKELATDREQHFAHVAQMFRDLDVFVFTLGLTETWSSQIDDAAFPTCPGKRFGEFSPDRYYFRNLSLAENIEYMERFLELLSDWNPSARVILTVSPVPLAATMEDHHIIQSTTYSKAVLRVVAEEMRQRHENVDYFASYEIITATYNNERYFQDDKRNITPDGVDHVMWSFYRNFTNEAPEALVKVERPDEPTTFEARPCDEEQVLNLINAVL